MNNTPSVREVLPESVRDALVSNACWRVFSGVSEMQFKTRRKATLMICSDCGTQRSVSPSERNAAARPRCLACGGPLNRPRDIGIRRSKKEPDSYPGDKAHNRNGTDARGGGNDEIIR